MNINNIYARLAISNQNVVPFKQKEPARKQVNGPVQDVFVKSSNNSPKLISFGANVNVNDEDIQDILGILGLKGQPGTTSAGIPEIKRALLAQSALIKDTMNFLHIDGKNLETSEAKCAAINNRVRLDPKTGLNNIDALYDDIQYVKDEYLSKGKPVTFAMFDLDNFKSVNDLLSYDVGDVLIKLAASNINTAVAKQGFKAYRFGGEEFIVMMPGVEQEQALPIAQSIIDSVNGASFTEEHIEKYIASGQNLIDNLTQKQEPYKRVLDDIKQLKQLEEIMKDPCYKKVLASSPNVSSNIKQCRMRLHDEARYLLSRGVEIASNSSETELLMSSIERLEKGEKVENVFAANTPLSSLLYSMFYKQDKINEIRKWVEYVQLPNDKGEPRGFTMSGGVIQFDDAKYDSNEYIHDTGEVLAYAKRNQKGRLYEKIGANFGLYKPKRGKC